MTTTTEATTTGMMPATTTTTATTTTAALWALWDVVRVDEEKVGCRTEGCTDQQSMAPASPRYVV